MKVILPYQQLGCVMANPYEAVNIPLGDAYSCTPLYGRYKAPDDDKFPTTLSPIEIVRACRPENDMIPDYPEGQ